MGFSVWGTNELILQAVAVVIKRHRVRIGFHSCLHGPDKSLLHNWNKQHCRLFPFPQTLSNKKRSHVAFLLQ